MLSSSENRFCSNTLKALMKHERSLAFLQPVDPVLLQIPDYFDIIKHPMDLSTIQRKLQAGEYDSVDDFCADIRLMLDNCYLYNNPGDPVTLDAKELERTFKQCLTKRKTAMEMLESEDGSNEATPSGSRSISKPRVPSHSSSSRPTHITMPADQYDRCKGAIKEMRKSKHSEYNWPFLQPVDAAAWGAVDYYDIIKRPMDIATLDKNLREDKYSNEEQFYADAKLIFRNCYTYNPEGHPVHAFGKTLENVLDQYWERAHKKPQAPKATDSSLHSRPQSASNKRENDDAGKLEESRKKIKITIKGDNVLQASASKPNRVVASDSSSSSSIPKPIPPKQPVARTAKPSEQTIKPFPVYTPVSNPAPPIKRKGAWDSNDKEEEEKELAAIQRELAKFKQEKERMKKEEEEKAHREWMKEAEWKKKRDIQKRLKELGDAPLDLLKEKRAISAMERSFLRNGKDYYNARKNHFFTCDYRHIIPTQTVRGMMSENHHLPRPQLPLEHGVEEGTAAFYMQAVQESLKRRREEM